MTEKLYCPKCGRELVREFYERRIRFRCPAGHGECMTVSGVRSLCGDPGFVGGLWHNACYLAPTGSVECPVCRRPMKTVAIDVGEKELEIDVCCSCQEIWFDPNELGAIPVYAPPAEPELPPEAREKLALFEVERIEREAAETPEDGIAPDNAWQFLAAVLGFPYKREKVAYGLPFATWGMLFVCVALFVAGLFHGSFVEELGFVPAEPWRLGGATILASMFIHAGVWHLVGNMYFLYLFGSELECAMGRWKYLALALVSGLSATLCCYLVHRHSLIPCVGASGFISGIVAAFAVLYPQVRISFVVRRWFMYGGFLSLPAWAAFLLWLLFQLAMAYLESKAPGGGVAHSAHLGGAAAGLICGAVMRYFRMREADDFARRVSAPPK